MDNEEQKVYQNRSRNLILYKNDRKYGSDISHKKIVRISNRYDPLPDEDEDTNEMNNIVKENSTDYNKRKVKKKIDQRSILTLKIKN